MPREKGVCDASVIINFAKIRRLDLLLESFEKPLLIPQEVFREMVENGLEKREQDARLIEKGVLDESISVKKVRRHFPHPYLDEGEKAVISLALQERIQTVCIDEAAARNAAKHAGLKPIGSLGILARSVRNRKISAQEAFDLLDEMIRRDYRISAKIVEKFRTALRERSP